MTLTAEKRHCEDSEEQLLACYGGLGGEALIRVMAEHVFPGRVALVSSFGAESAVLLHMVSQVDPALPVIFLNTGKLFGETIRYRDKMIEQLGLRDVRSIRPGEDDVKAEDHNGLLWTREPDACCDLRKVRPLAGALEGFDAWITGRKRFQSSSRTTLAAIESAEDRTKINPLADWSFDQLKSYMTEHELQAHPLVKDGFLSIGCMPCTRRVHEGEANRAGRWAGRGKNECGIHLGAGI